MTRKKILCLIGQLGLGGTERQLFLFLKHLDRKRFDPIVMVCNGDADNHWHKIYSEQLETDILYLGERSKLAKLARFRLNVAKLQPDIVFAWSFYTNAFCLAAGRTPFIGSMRNDIDAAARELSTLHFRQCLRPKTLVINSSRSGEELLSAGIPETRIKFIPNIYEPMTEMHNREEIRRELGIPENALTVAVIGRDNESKNLRLFVDTVGKMIPDFPQIHAMMIAPQPDSPLAGYIRGNGWQKHFTLTGPVPNARKLLPAADIYFLCSREEGMPNVLLEAIDAGAAIIATDINGVRDIIGTEAEQRTTIIPSEDAGSASKAMRKLCSNQELRKKMSQNLRHRLDYFSPETIMPMFYDILDKDL